MLSIPVLYTKVRHCWDSEKKENNGKKSLPNPKVNQAVASFVSEANSATGKQVTESGRSLDSLGDKVPDKATWI